ncbi:MAG: response regulator transcription factor [Campylobacterales bacterium]|nr:response regulator transcription factor [Campylobacterales bacterium]
MNFKNFNLLLVEDEQMIIDNLYCVLKDLFCKVFIARDGEEAQEKFLSESVDLVITDFVMPKVDGGELAKFIREKDRTTPIIMMSNHTDSEKLLKIINLNISAYLVKPIKYEELLDTLEGIFPKDEKEKEVKIDYNTIYNYSKKVVIKDGESISLTSNEIKLLELLLDNQDRVVSKDIIDLEIFDGFMPEGSIRNMIYRFRKKIASKQLKTIKGVGLMLSKVYS